MANQEQHKQQANVTTLQEEVEKTAINNFSKPLYAVQSFLCKSLPESVDSVGIYDLITRCIYKPSPVGAISYSPCFSVCKFKNFPGCALLNFCLHRHWVEEDGDQELSFSLADLTDVSNIKPSNTRSLYLHDRGYKLFLLCISFLRIIKNNIKKHECTIRWPGGVKFVAFIFKFDCRQSKVTCTFRRIDATVCVFIKALSMGADMTSLYEKRR